MTQRIVQTPGYGGDVIEFKEDERGYPYSIHRTWIGRPKEHRPDRYKSANVKDHIISKGCINVQPEVYEELKNCCILEPLLITR